MKELALLIASPDASLHEERSLAIVRQAITPEQIEALEARMLEDGRIELPVIHRICDGVYFREVTLPAGYFAIGHAHPKDTMNFVMGGSVSVLIDGVVRKIEAGAVFVSKAMQRKVGYIHSPCRWITAHRTDLTDIAAIEEEIIVKSEAFKAYERRAVNAPKRVDELEDAIEADRADYFMALSELGFTHAQARAMSENDSDQIRMPEGLATKVHLANSQREGIGVFASAIIDELEVIGPARIRDKRTPLGRFTNHSANPNAAMALGPDGILLVAMKPIIPHQEITVDYRRARELARSLDS